jgi:preprotein translocase subunit SecA
LIERIETETLRLLFTIEVQVREQATEARPSMEEAREMRLARRRKASPASQAAPHTVRREGPKVRRNQACHCGSGKKHKRCCGR